MSVLSSELLILHNFSETTYARINLEVAIHYGANYLQKLKNDIGYNDVTGEIIFPSSAVAVCVSKEGKLLCVKQYRAIHQLKTIELPGGKQELNETAVETARRELLEETGVKGSKSKLIASIDLDLSASTHVTHIVKFSDVEESDGTGKLSTLWLGLDDAWEMVEKGEITHAPTMIAITSELLRWRA
jgi:8-oxo-dGTP pyrophosphatase MutT (NUDIX family)